MKKVFTFLSAVLLTVLVVAQSPEKMSYQAVIRDTNNNLVMSYPVGIRVSILQGAPGGLEVYNELFNPNPQTNANGLLTIEIGTGIPLTGTFAGIDWSAGPYFIKTEVDPTGSTNYTVTGTTQLLSVPYALHAKTADSATETDPVFTASVAAGITGTDTANWNNKLDSEVDGSVTNELQQLSYYGDTIFISQGNYIVIPGLKYLTKVQYRLNSGETPISIYNMGFPLDSLYGKTYAGGLIFYLNTISGEGLVAAPVDQSSAPWGCSGTAIGGTLTTINTGYANTNAIVAGCTTPGIAAHLCDTLALGGYTDWYLPAKDELNLMYVNLHTQGLGGFVSSYGNYWSSSESAGYETGHAWLQGFSAGNQDGFSKYYTGYVRAVRAF